MRPGRRWLVTIAACVGLSFSAANTAMAHDPAADRAAGVLSDQGYERMRELAHDLDTQGRHVGKRVDHGRSWFYRNDRRFRRSVANFARRASSFHERMDSYRTAPWQLDDELRGLLRDAREVQSRIQRSRYTDDHTAADWRRTVEILNEMIRVHESDTTGEYGRPEAGERHDRYEAEGSAGRAYDSQQVGSLVHELAERSTRLREAANRLSEGYRGSATQGESIRAIQHFTEQAETFHERYEGGLSPDDVRGNVAHLWKDGREADEQFRQANVPELQGEWAAMLQLLARIRSAADF